MRLAVTSEKKLFSSSSLCKNLGRQSPERTACPQDWVVQEWRQWKPTSMSAASAPSHVWSQSECGPHSWVNTFPFGLPVLGWFFRHIRRKRTVFSQTRVTFVTVPVASNTCSLNLLAILTHLHTNFSSMLTRYLQVCYKANLEEQ